MRAKLVQTMALTGCVLVLQGVTAARENDPRVILSAGVDFATVTCGGDVDIEDTSVPVTATVDYGRVAFRLTVPCLSVKAPEATISEPDGEPLPGAGAAPTGVPAFRLKRVI